jgi:hypothetical protein
LGAHDKDAYGFIEEFEEVCHLMQVPSLAEDEVKLRFVPFSLKENARR